MVKRFKNILKDMGNGLSHAHEEGFRREGKKSRRRIKNESTMSKANEDGCPELQMVSYNREQAQTSG